MLERHIAAVDKFRQAFGRLGIDEDAYPRVAELAGPAVIAAEEAAKINKLLGAMAAETIADWELAYRNQAGHVMSEVPTACDHAKGILQARLDTANAQEKSLAGRLAWFIRFPYEVREAAGLPADSAGGRVAFWFAVAVETVAGLLVAGAVALVASVT